MRTTITFFTIFTLVAILAVGSIPTQAFASPGDSTLLRIATQAHEEIKVQLSRADNVSSEITELFDQGTDELEALNEAIANEDPEAKQKHFLAAMDLFKKISHMISDLSSGESVETLVSARPDYQSTLDRMEKYIHSIQRIADRHGAEIDFSEFERLFDLANQQLLEGEYDNVKESIDAIKQEINEINKTLREKAQEKNEDRARIFAQKYLEKLETIIAEAEDMNYPEEIIEKLKAAKEMISDSSNPKQIIEEINKILSFKEQLDLSKFDRIISRTDQIEEKLDNLEVTEENASIIEDARSSIIEIRAFVDDRNYEDAESTLIDLMSLLKELEN